MNAALLIIVLTMAGALALGLRAGRGREMTLEQWSVGGRGFGTIFVFLLLAGEIYTTFTFLGASGYAYGRGAPTYYILGYGCLAYILSYWLLPLIWRYAKDNRLISQSDFFSRKYDSPTLGVVVSLVGLVALVPYLVLQLKGLGIIVAAAGYGAVSSTTAIWVRAAVVTAYVMASGVRGSAWTAVVKDVMILAIVVFLGLYLPIHYYGGLTDMFQAIDAAKPGFLALPPKGESAWWFASTVLLTALGFFMWPHSFASVFTAREAQVFRRNANCAAALPAHHALRLLRGIRGDPAGSGAARAGDRSRAGPAFGQDVLAVDGGCDRCRRGADGAGAGLDDPHGRSDIACAQSLPSVAALGR